MALMERVAALLRANVNELIDRAEDPEKMLRQLERDLENQLLQLKTQLATAIAERHVMLSRQKAEVDAGREWREKASLAVGKGRDDMARAALERALMHEQMAQEMVQTTADQSDEVEALRASYTQLEGKRKQAGHSITLLSAQMRRAKTMGKAISARQAADAVALSLRQGPELERLKERIRLQEAKNFAGNQMLEAEYLEDQFVALDRDDKVERLLEELKEKRGMLAQG